MRDELAMAALPALINRSTEYAREELRNDGFGEQSMNDRFEPATPNLPAFDDPIDLECEASRVARSAYAIADAMMKVRALARL